MGTGLRSYEIKWLQDEVSMRWSGYRIKLVWNWMGSRLSGCETEWVQD